MNINVRQAHNDDVVRLVDLYREMEAEQTIRKPIWAFTDGLDEPFEQAFHDARNQEDSWLCIGEIDGVPVSVIWYTVEPMLDRAEGARTGRIRLIYTEPAARGVGVGHAMLEAALTDLRALGIRHFDAPVGPGQRATKNFFEAHAFAARSIIMFHEDADGLSDA